MPPNIPSLRLDGYLCGHDFALGILPNGQLCLVTSLSDVYLREDGPSALGITEVRPDPFSLKTARITELPELKTDLDSCPLYGPRRHATKALVAPTLVSAVDAIEAADKINAVDAANTTNTPPTLTAAPTPPSYAQQAVQPNITRLLFALPAHNFLATLQHIKNCFMTGHHVIITGSLVQPVCTYGQVGVQQFIVGYDHYNDQQKIAAQPLMRERTAAFMVESVALAETDWFCLIHRAQIHLCYTPQGYTLHPARADNGTPFTAETLEQIPYLIAALKEVFALKGALPCKVVDFYQRFTLTKPTALKYHRAFEHLHPDSPRPPVLQALLQQCHPCSFNKYQQLLQAPHYELFDQAQEWRAQHQAEEAQQDPYEPTVEYWVSALRFKRLNYAQNEVRRSAQQGKEPNAVAENILKQWQQQKQKDAAKAARSAQPQTQA